MAVKRFKVFLEVVNFVYYEAETEEEAIEMHRKAFLKSVTDEDYFIDAWEEPKDT
jgi:hypothetical protein